jgi:hypothetical protein
VTKLPVYELKFALEGRVDEFGDPLPNVTHVQFKRDYTSAGDMKEMLKVTGGDLSDIETNQTKIVTVALALLPRLTDLSAEDAEMLKASDFTELMGILGPFMEF